MATSVLGPESFSFGASAVLPIVTGVAIMALGTAVLVRERGSNVSLLYFIYTLMVGAWLIPCGFLHATSYPLFMFFYAKSAHVGILMIPPSLYHFTVVFLRTYQKNRKYVWLAWTVSAVFLSSALFTDVLFDSLYLYSWGYYPKLKLFSAPLLLYFFLMMVVILRHYWREYHRAPEKSTRRLRARAFLLAFGIGYLASFDFLPAFGIPFRPLGYIPMFVLIIIVARTIWRYRLVDITPAFAANQIIDTMSDALLVLDRENVVRLANKAAGELFGYDVQDMVGRPVTLLIACPRLQEELERGIKAEEVRNVEIPCRSKKGTALTLSLSASIMRDEKGAPVATVCTMRDITEHRRMEGELLKAQKIESIGLLAGGIAHDFNNLLSAILGNVSLSRMKTDRETKIYKWLEEAEKAIIRARDLTQQLLTFSRGGEPVKRTVFLGDLAREAAEFALSGSKVRCEWNIPRDLWPVEADEGQMNQVIHNLIINAVQAMPEGGIVRVRCENSDGPPDAVLPPGEGRYVKLSVEDSGIGILKEHIPKIFDPYFTTKQRGSGLGLTTTYSIVKKHDGYITVESEPGAGSTFSLYLPASQNSREARQARQDQAKAVFRGKGRVLVMDDEEAILDVVSSMLLDFGYAAETVRDGVEALKLYRKAQESGKAFDAVIMDLTIPGGMGGEEAVEKLLEIDPHARIIVSSGYSNDPIMANYRKYGFTDIIAKPYESTELKKVMHRVTGSRPEGED